MESRAVFFFPWLNWFRGFVSQALTSANAADRPHHQPWCWWLNYPSEKYARQIGNLPQFSG